MVGAVLGGVRIDRHAADGIDARRLRRVVMMVDDGRDAMCPIALS